MEKEILIVNLSKEMEYSKGGDFLKTASLEFSPPNMMVFDEVSDLSQLVMMAFNDNAKNAKDMDVKKPDKAPEFDAKVVKMALMNSSNIKFKDVATVFRKLALISGTYDGETPLTESFLKALEIEDFYKIVCEYIANFTVPSLFSGLEEGLNQ